MHYNLKVTMITTTKTETELVISALKRQDETSLRNGLCRLLDRDDMTLIENILAQTEDLGHESWFLQTALYDEAQQVCGNGIRNALFCIPVLLDPELSPVLRMESVHRLIKSMAGPDERFVLVNGWVHPRDLSCFNPTLLRRLVRELKAEVYGKNDMGLNQENAGSVQPLPAQSNDIWGELQIMFNERTHVSRIASRFIVGLATGIEGCEYNDGGLFTNLVDGQINEAAMDLLAEEIDGIVGSSVSTLRPGMPVHALSDAQATISTLCLDARLRQICFQTGKKPVAHYCVHDECVHVCVTHNEGAVLDSIVLRAVGVDAQLVIDAVFKNSSAVIAYEHLIDLPKGRKPVFH